MHNEESLPGHWITSRNRRLSLAEMFRLQGMNPEKVIVDVSMRTLGQQIGNAMSVNVVERVLLIALRALNMIAPTVPDRWKRL